MEAHLMSMVIISSSDRLAQLRENSVEHSRAPPAASLSADVDPVRR
jgi:hypothetical protein